MRWPRTLALYVAREIGLFSGLSFFGVALVLISQQLLERLDQLFTLGVGGDDLPRLLEFIVSLMAAHALPIAFAFGVTLTLGRLTTNSEILAIRSLGISPAALLVPALSLAVVIGMGMAWLLADIEPRARLGLRQLLADVALRGTIVQDGRFRGMQDRVIYVDERSPEGELRGVMIHDSTNSERPYVTFAESGSLRYDDRTGILKLSLKSGQILVDPDARDPERVQLVSFDDFEYPFDALSLLRGRYGRRNPDELDIDELPAVIAQIDAGTQLRNLRTPHRRRYELELHRRRAMPLAPLVFALIAVGLGTGRRRSQGLALVAIATTVFGYYASMTLGLELAAEGRLDPRLAAWAPNALFATIGVILAWRVARSAGE